MPLLTTGATVPGLYSHIAHSVDKEEGEIPPPFKGAKPKQTRGRGKPKGKPQDHRQNPPKAQETDKTYAYDSPNNYYHNDNYTTQVKIMATDLLMVKAVINNLEPSHKEAEAKDLNTIKANFRTISFREAHINRIILNTAPTTNPIFREIKQMTTEDRAVARVLSMSEDAVMVGPHSTFQYQYYIHDQQIEQYGPPCSLCSSFNHSPKHCYKEHDISNIMEKMSINPHQQQQGNLYQ